MGLWSFIKTKILLIIFILATIGFGIATICLAVDNHNLNEDLDNLKKNKPEIEMNDRYRLPGNVVPDTYDLTLYPDLLAKTFKGKAEVVVNIVAATNDVWMHAHLLDVSKVQIDDVDCSYELDAKYELLTIKAKDTLEVNSNHKIYIEFSGDMFKNTMVGLYASTYKDEMGADRAIATSKFEPTYARQAYPCFDEPNMKTKFKVHIARPADNTYHALSNMPVESEDAPSNNEIMVHFQESVPMSTYLSCFIVSDFKKSSESILQLNGDVIPYNVFATPAQLSKTEYAASVGKKIMEFYLDYFKIPYPLPKLDMVAIPDFVSGAMEHWGLVTFRETALLYDDKTSSASNKLRVATVIAHELAHSWFGNLVTMDWWNDLWLNEGFASYIEYKGTDNAEPTWKLLEQFTVTDLHPVLKLDSKLSSHPIVQTVETPDQITAIFDTISYNKGASILRMLEGAIGATIFQDGVYKYLEKYQFGNAVTAQFLKELNDLTPDVDVEEFMRTFTVQMGYPVVNVEKVSKGFKLTQKRFLLDPSNSGEPAQPYNYKWTIPITYRTSSGANSEVLWFKHNQNSYTIETDAPWIKINNDQIGYYRVNYQEDQWAQIIGQMSSFGVLDRTHLLEETFRLAEAQQISYKIPLDLTKYLVNEEDYVPWSNANNLLRELDGFLTSSERSSDFRDYVNSLLKKSYDKWTWTEKPEEEFLDIQTRVTVLSFACAMGYEPCLNEARSQFNLLLNDGTQPSPNLKDIVFSYGMVTATSAEWNKLWDIYVNEGDANEKLRMLRGLASIRDPSLLTKLVERAKNEDYVRGQDYFSCLIYISRNPVGTSIVWDYVRENWEYLVARFGLNDRYLGTLIPSITSSFSTQVKKQEMEAFFAQYPEAGAGVTARQQALETVDSNIKWLANNKEVVEMWINDNAPVN